MLQMYHHHYQHFSYLEQKTKSLSLHKANISDKYLGSIEPSAFIIQQYSVSQLSIPSIIAAP